ncbi:hypothetical protein [Achromobacter insolitus]|uniref:hypothetical protein n=1 Tax=Achromobacter insolitus TaxID=217204 RepID=UPI0009ED5C08|nr:hypothetical protein [Achromobacter insolitus]
MQTKVTKKAQNDVRIASNKIERALAKLSRLKSNKLQTSDGRIFPGSYAPVITVMDRIGSFGRCATSAGLPASCEL